MNHLYATDSYLSHLFLYEKGATPKSEAIKNVSFVRNKTHLINPPSINANPKEALNNSLDYLGYVDMRYITESCNVSLDDALLSLKNRIFLNPRYRTDNPYEGYEIASSYLSGNLYRKYFEAMEANKASPGLYNENIKALALLMPKKIDAKDIYISLGTPWIPTSLIKKFIASILYVHCDLIHDEKTGVYEFRGKRFGGSANIITYGTKRMQAITIIEKTLNLEPIVVRDCKKEADGSFSNKINAKETELAIEKQKKILDAFNAFIKNNSELSEAIEKYYRSKFVCRRKSEYDGSFLTYPGLNKDITLFKFQSDAVAKMLFSPNTLLAHDVGSGKTYEMIAAVMKMRQWGIAKKPMIVVPKGILSQWGQIFKMMYPKANILLVDNTVFCPSKRSDTLKRIKDEDFDAIIIDYSSFDMIDLSPRETKKRLQEAGASMGDIAYNNPRQTAAFSRIYDKFKLNKDNMLRELSEEEVFFKDCIFFDDLGVDRLFLDECHNYKNVPFRTSSSGILGINPVGSAKCQSMLDKVRYIQKNHDGCGVVFATGTPITNSISDAYNIERYLQSGEIEYLGIGSFDDWVRMFCSVETRFEIDVTTSKYRPVNRFSAFHNIPELSLLFGDIACFHHVNKSEDMPSLKGYSDISIAPKDSFFDFLKWISSRADGVRDHKPMKFGESGEKEDNMLYITTDGRKAALDLRLIEQKEFAPLEKGKVYHAARVIADIYKESENKKKTQLVFCDISTPKDGFNIYDELKNELVSLGVSEKEIAYVHDAKNSVAKQRMIKKTNAGDLRIIIGSTPKLGTGVNMQSRLVAIHHLDVPWKPSDMVQREGRILRPGNMNKRIYIYRYILQNSFDSYSWQLLETKQRFISTLLSGDAQIRNASDVDDMVLDYASVKALSLGNEKIKEREETYNELSRLLMLQEKKKERNKELSQSINSYNEEIKDALACIKRIEEDLKIDTSINGDKEAYRNALYEETVKALSLGKLTKVLSYRGFDIYCHGFMVGALIKMVMKAGETYEFDAALNRTGMLKRVDNLIDSLPKRREDLMDMIALKKAFIVEAKKEIEANRLGSAQVASLKEKLAKMDEALGIKNA